jgi:WD40 repeat protein
VAALVAGGVALVERGDARQSAVEAQAGRLAAQSREAAPEHPDLALLLALEAGRLDDGIEARGALLGALEHGARIHAWLQGFDAPVNSAAFSPDGSLLAVVTQEGTTLWDTTTWRQDGESLPTPQANWADFSPDGRTLAIAAGGPAVELWSVATRQRLRRLRDPAPGARAGHAIALFSPDGRVLAAGGQESNHMTLWRTATGRVLGRPIATHPPGSGQHSVAFTPDSRRIAAPGAPGTVGIWEVQTGRRSGRPLSIADTNVEAVIFAEGGKTLIASDDGGNISIVDASTGEPRRPPLSAGGEAVASLDVTRDGRLLAAGSFDGTAHVWDLRTGVRLGQPLVADTSPVSDVAFSPDGGTLVSSHVGATVAWAVDGRHAIGRPLGGPRDVLTTVSFTPDGRSVVAGRLAGDAVVYDAATRRQARRFPVGSVVSAVDVHPGGELAAVGTVTGAVRLFDLATGRAVARLPRTNGTAVWDLAFSPDGELLAVAVDRNGVEGFYGQQRQGEVQLWAVDSRRRAGQVIRPGAGSVLSLAFSPDGALLATGSYAGRLDLWDLADRRRHGRTMRVTDDGVLSVAFEPEGRLVAGGGAIGPVRVWRVADQEPAFPPLAGHTGPVTGTSFDTEGAFLVTTTLFGGSRLWDPDTGRAYGDDLVASPRPDSLTPTIPLPFLGLRNAVSPDGTLLAVPGADTRAMLFDLDSAVWRRRACEIVGRNLTREEWRLYLPAGTPHRATCSEWPTR